MEDRVMKKLTLLTLLVAALVVTALPAMSQADGADTALLPDAVETSEAPTTVEDLFPASEILGNDTLDFTPTAGGGFGCYYTCGCNGTPLYCCPSGGGVSCKVTNVIQCPQIANC